MSDCMAAFASNVAQPRSLTEALRPQSPPPPPPANQPQPNQPYTPPAEQPPEPLQANASQQQADRPQRDDNPAPAGDDFRDVLEKRLSTQSDEQKPQTDKRKADPKDTDTKGVVLAAAVGAEAEVHQNTSAGNAKLAIVQTKSQKTPTETAAGSIKNAKANAQKNAQTTAEMTAETTAQTNAQTGAETAAKANANANEPALPIASEAAATATEKSKDAKPEKTALVEKSTAPAQLNLKNPAVTIAKNAEGSAVQNKQVQIVKQTATDASQQPKTNNAAEVIKNTTTDHPGRIQHRTAPTEQTDNQALQQVNQADDVEKVVSNETILNQTNAKITSIDPVAAEPELTIPENKTGQSTQQFNQDRNRQILEKAIEDVVEVRLSQATAQSATNGANPAAVVKNTQTAISATDAAQNTSRPASITDPISRAAANENAISPAKQLADRIAANPPRPEQEITITLNPEELGRIKISFQHSAGEITGILEVEKPETRYDIERQLPQIAAALQDSGVNVKRIDVVTSDQPNQQDQQNHKNNSPDEFDEPNPHHFGDAPRQNSDNAAHSSNEIPSGADYSGPQRRANVAT
ncbi:MAG: flagellar hook-length control protein FliK, partial [Planctomycetes bacterium]|nr:flagellar hook-length control protein FliK [Planctomycetota bacterium]